MVTYMGLIVKLIGAWGYWAIAVGMAMGNACLPVPSEAVLPFAGYLVFLGKLTLVQAIAAGLLGGMIGSILAYTVGRFGGRPFVLKHGCHLFISARNVSRADRWVEKHGESAAFWSRLVPIVRTFVSLPLGMAKMPFPRFVAYSFAGSIPWTVVFICAGKKLGEKWSIIKVYGDTLNVITVLILAVLVVIECIKTYRNVRDSF